LVPAEFRALDLFAGSGTLGRSDITPRFLPSPLPSSDLDGKSTIPILFRFQGLPSQPSFILGDNDNLTSLYLASKSGYGTTLFELSRRGDTTVHISPMKAAVRVQVRDVAEESRACLLTITGPAFGHREVPLCCVTDENGACRIEDLPPGILRFEAFPFPERVRNKFTPGKLFPPMKDIRAPGVFLAVDSFSVRWRDTLLEREIRLETGDEVSLNFTIGEKVSDDDEPVLFGDLAESEGVRVGLEFRKSNGMRGSMTLETNEGRYETTLPGPGKYRIETRFESRLHGHEILVDMGDFDLGPGEKRRLDPVYPHDAPVLKVSGRVPPPPTKDHPMPSWIQIEPVDPRGKFRTESKSFGYVHRLATIRRELPFTTFLMPGRYRIVGTYPRGSGGWSSRYLGEFVLESHLDGLDIPCPWVAQLSVFPVNKATGAPISSRRMRWIVGRARSDLSQKENRDKSTFLVPGEYTILLIGPGRVPARQDFTVNPGEKGVKVTVPMDSGEGAVLGGKVLRKKDGSPLAGTISLMNTTFELHCGNSGLLGGRFRFDGLPGGEYLIHVYPGDETGPKEFREKLDDGEKKSGLILEVD
jgi:hypothetical protein